MLLWNRNEGYLMNLSCSGCAAGVGEKAGDSFELLCMLLSGSLLP